MTGDDRCPGYQSGALNDTKSVFNNDGRMKLDGAQNVVAVLSLANESVKARKDKIDISKMCTAEFVDTAKWRGNDGT